MIDTRTIQAALEALLQETDALLACAEPDTGWVERYRLMRQETFGGLERLVQHTSWSEQNALHDLLAHLLEKDAELLRLLEHHCTRCRDELAAVAKARHALDNYALPATIHVLERGV